MMKVSSKFNVRDYKRASSRYYEIALVEARKLYSGENHPFYGRKRPEHSARMSGDSNPMRIHHIDMSGENNPYYGHRHTEAVKKHLSDSRKGITLEDRHGQETALQIKQKMSESRTGEKNGFFGKQHSDDTIEHLKYIASLRPAEFYSDIGKKIKQRPLLVCPHCGKEMDERNAKRWHFNRCKYLAN
jgi:hypothetical protein